MKMIRTARKTVLCMLAVMAACFSAMAKDTTDYMALAETGSAVELQEAFERRGKLKTQVFGPNRETMLMLALKYDRDRDVIAAMLDMENSSKSKVKEGDSSLMASAELNSTTYLIRAKAKDGRTPLMFAAEHSTHPDVVELVITKGAVLKQSRKELCIAKDKNGLCAFDYARRNPETEVYNTLLRYADDPSMDSPKNEPVVLAVEDSEPEPQSEPVSNSEETEELVPSVSGVKPSEPETVSTDAEETVSELTEELVAENSAPSSAIKPYTQTYLYDFIAEPVPESEDDGHPAVSFISDPNLRDKNGVSLLMKAAKAGNDWDVRNLLAQGADVQLRDNEGWTALMYAVRYQNTLEVVTALVDHGAHLRVRNKYNATPLLLAADYSQNPEIIARLLRDRSSTEDEVFKAFILALTSTAGSEHIQRSKVKLFLDMSIPLNRVWKGKTPLMYAAQYAASTSVLKMLLDSGARVDIRSSEGKSAFDYAKENHRLSRDSVYWSLNGTR